MLCNTDIVEKVGVHRFIAWVIIVEMQKFITVGVFVIAILRVLAVSLGWAVNIRFRPFVGV